MRHVTLDSNVYISALNFGGIPRRILNLAIAGDIEIAMSEPIIAEVLRVLGDKFEWPLERIAQTERAMRRLGILVTPAEQLHVVPDDPDDDRIIECAVAGSCEAIVTGDKDLLRLGSYKGIHVVTPSDFMRRRQGKA